MSNRRLLDRMVTPEWMSTALRIARMNKPWPEARQLLEVALRDEIESPTGRKKTATVLASSWLRPTPEASQLVEWAQEHASGDMRVWHLGVLLGNYSFMDDICAEIGRTLSQGREVETPVVRSSMKKLWGDRGTVDVSVRSAIRTLRAFGALVGPAGESVSTPGERIEVEPAVFPWLVHAFLIGRRVKELDKREIYRAPELFMFRLPARILNGYPRLERFSEGGGREVVGIVEQRQPLQPAAKQMHLDV